MDFAPITYELWDAFVAERQHWEIIEITPDAVVATDRKRYTKGDEFVNPIDEGSTFTQQGCVDRAQAAFYIGLRSMQAALEKTSIIQGEATC